MLPFEGEWLAIANQKLTYDPPPLRAKALSISSAVEDVVLRALAKAPSDRFVTVQDFAAALEQAAQLELYLSSNVMPNQSLPPAMPEKSVPRPEVHSPASAQPVSHHPPSPAPQKQVEPPLLPPTQNAGGLLLQEARYSSSDSASVEVKPISGPADMKVSVWRIGKRQVLAGIIGFAIVVCLSLPTALLLRYRGSTNELIIVIGLIFLGLVLVTPEFFGAVFGPWVGLFTGVGPLVGFFILYGLTGIAYVRFYFSREAVFDWPLLLGIVLVGFISGFAMHKKKGLYNIGRTLGFSSLGVVVGMVFATFVTLIRQGYFIFSFTEVTAYYVILGLILLPILLVIYNRIANRASPPVPGSPRSPKSSNAAAVGPAAAASPLLTQTFPPTTSPHEAILPQSPVSLSSDGLPQATIPSQSPAALLPPPTLGRTKRRLSPAVVVVLILLALILLGGGSLGVYSAATGKWPWNASHGASTTTSSGTGAQVTTSATGRIWHAQTSGTSQALGGVAWSGLQFVAVGSSGTILTSP
jgi:energy-coupling factor transport system substrate-specific component